MFLHSRSPRCVLPCVLARYSILCLSTLPVLSPSNQILSLNHNENRYFESRIAIHRASLVCLDKQFVGFLTTTPLFVRFFVSFGKGRTLQSTRDSSIATVPHSSIDPSDPSIPDSSVVSLLFPFIFVVNLDYTVSRSAYGNNCFDFIKSIKVNILDA